MPHTLGSQPGHRNQSNLSHCALGLCRQVARKNAQKVNHDHASWSCPSCLTLPFPPDSSWNFSDVPSLRVVPPPRPFDVCLVALSSTPGSSLGFPKSSLGAAETPEGSHGTGVRDAGGILVGTAEAERWESMWAQNEQAWGWFSGTRELRRLGRRRERSL